MSCDYNQAKIVIYDITQNNIYSFDSPNASLKNFKGKNFSILIKGNGFRSFYCECGNDETIYINMPHIGSSLNIQGKKIELGRGLFVNDNQSCLFTKGEYMLKGDVTINPGVSFDANAKLEIN